jgi:DNA polymerase eta
MNVSSVQLAFTGIDVTEVGQQSIEGFLQSSRVNKRSREDGINSDQHFQSGNTRTLDDQSNVRPSYTCPRCNKTYRLPDTTPDVDLDVALKALRMEHEDFHFAQDLTRESDQVPIVVGTPRPLNINKKQRKEPAGIEKFFGRK